MTYTLEYLVDRYNPAYSNPPVLDGDLLARINVLDDDGVEQPRFIRMSGRKVYKGDYVALGEAAGGELIAQPLGSLKSVWLGEVKNGPHNIGEIELSPLIEWSPPCGFLGTAVDSNNRYFLMNHGISTLDQKIRHRSTPATCTANFPTVTPITTTGQCDLRKVDEDYIKISDYLTYQSGSLSGISGKSFTLTPHFDFPNDHTFRYQKLDGSVPVNCVWRTGGGLEFRADEATNIRIEPPEYKRDGAGKVWLETSLNTWLRGDVYEPDGEGGWSFYGRYYRNITVAICTAWTPAHHTEGNPFRGPIMDLGGWTQTLEPSEPTVADPITCSGSSSLVFPECFYE